MSGKQDENTGRITRGKGKGKENRPSSPFIDVSEFDVSDCESSKRADCGSSKRADCGSSKRADCGSSKRKEPGMSSNNSFIFNEQDRILNFINEATDEDCNKRTKIIERSTRNRQNDRDQSSESYVSHTNRQNDRDQSSESYVSHTNHQNNRDRS